MNLFKKFSTFYKQISLPSEMLFSKPEITIYGKNRITIEQYYKLVFFSNNEIKLQLKKGTVHIIGSSFKIKMMFPEEIILEGTIKEVNFLS